jgi:hypothetical protein
MSTFYAEPDIMSERPQNEINRQQRAIDALGDNFQYPLFNGRQAIESQRKSGYKNTARAAREIIDNAFEAGAKNVWVVYDRPSGAERAKSERRDSVSAIAFIDNGPGMIPNMARYALSWGGGTRFDDPTGIGRFGFGLPNSSINQTRRVEVYTRTDSKLPWTRVALDINPEKLKAISVSGLVKVDEPDEAPLPAFVTEYVKRNKIALGTGTIVVWDRPDRLTARSGTKLKELMLDDFGVVYRYMLDEFTLVVDGVTVRKVDPLFVTSDALHFKPAKEGGAEKTFDPELTVAYSRDPETGAQHLRLLKTVESVREARVDPNVEALGIVSVKVVRFPYGFAAERIVIGEKIINGEKKPIWQEVPKNSDEYKRLQIRKKRRGVSFVRANREIDTFDALPTTSSDKANGLGEWPVLQGYALHWGIEVRFGPSLDEAFGIGNDKQTVSPIEDFWRVMVEAEVDRAAREEQKHQQTQRRTKEAEEAERQTTDPNHPNPATEAAAGAEEAMGRNRPLPPERVEETQQKFDEAVNEKVKETGQTRDEAEEAVKREAKRKRYAIKFFESEGGVFYKPDLGNGLQRIAMINKCHPFFKGFYASLVGSGNSKARQAVDLLLLALAKSELEGDDNLKRIYEHQRDAEWTPFLKVSLNILDQLQPVDLEEREEDVS